MLFLELRLFAKLKEEMLSFTGNQCCQKRVTVVQITEGNILYVMDQVWCKPGLQQSKRDFKRYIFPENSNNNERENTNIKDTCENDNHIEI